jgi:pantoate--beta-alanine ligase
MNMSELQIFHSVSEYRSFRQNLSSDISVGFVPTMGALHKGHASLIEKSAAENNFTVLSIFVNPTQFNNPDDLKKYPRTWEADVELAKAAGANVILSPKYEELYADNYRFQLSEKEFSKKLCGAHRPGHFDGVLTVVMKLLQIVNPKKAYFGEKDFQQLQLIQDMTKAFFLPVEIVPGPTVREADGLAMSSRNVRLTPEGREKAPLLLKALKDGLSFEKAKQLLGEKQIELEYLEEHFGRRYIAAYIDGVRLIDNVKI